MPRASSKKQPASRGKRKAVKEEAVVEIEPEILKEEEETVESTMEDVAEDMHEPGEAQQTEDGVSEDDKNEEVVQEEDQGAEDSDDEMPEAVSFKSAKTQMVAKKQTEKNARKT